MKFIILGKFEGADKDTDWGAFMGHNHEQAAGKCEQLGIVIENVYLTISGPCQFIVVMECPSADAMLSFQSWYNKQGRGSFEAIPAFDLDTAMEAAKNA